MREGFSINLNVGTILSEEFLTFDSDINPTTHETVLELRIEDVFPIPKVLPSLGTFYTNAVTAFALTD